MYFLLSSSLPETGIRISQEPSASPSVETLSGGVWIGLGGPLLALLLVLLIKQKYRITFSIGPSHDQS